MRENKALRNLRKQDRALLLFVVEIVGVCNANQMPVAELVRMDSVRVFRQTEDSPGVTYRQSRATSSTVFHFLSSRIPTVTT